MAAMKIPGKKRSAAISFPRLSLRYLDPIKVIQEHETFQGVG
jgi:hypothetical protein